MYDVTSMTSFEGMQHWIVELQALGVELSLVVAGTKIDLPAELRQVDTEVASKLAATLGAVHIETSSKDGTNCEEVFEQIGRMLVERGIIASPTEPTGPHRHAFSRNVSGHSAGPCSCG